MTRKTTRSANSGLSPLIYADTQKSADQLYIGKFFVPDAFISFRKGRKWYALLNQLEYARGMKESSFDQVLSLEEWTDNARQLLGKESVGTADVILALSKLLKIEGFKIASDFPAGLAFRLVEDGVKIDVAAGSLFPNREVKTEDEIKAIREGNRCSVAGIRAAEKALAASNIKNGKLYLENKALTSERLREVIEVACLRAGSVSMDTIAAGGDQACDPHCAGSGPLRANELIIVDVFPRVSKTGYFGDMTRTFLKGKASDAQIALVKAVRRAQKGAISMVRAGVSGSDIHAQVITDFQNLGYKTERRSGGAIGFIHGTGHGLGLEIHEAPRVSIAKNKLKENAVVTIEPGLYYPGLGGCRIEDVVAVRKDRAEKISSYHYKWIIE